MENLLLALPIIKKLGVFGASLRSDLSLQMVATKDIGEKAADLLNKLNFKRHEVFDFVGPQSISLVEATRIIGKKIGKPDLPYQQFPYDKAETILTSVGMSPNFVKSLIEMDKAFNENKIGPTQNLTTEHKGKTSLEMFFEKENLSLLDRD